MITDIEEYFTQGCGRCDRFGTPECSTQLWAEGLKELRRVCLSVGLVEKVKWGHPCYTHGGRNIAIIGAFRDDFRLSFFNAGLMQDPDGILEKSGGNTRFANVLRFTSAKQTDELENVIIRYLQEAMSYADRGLQEPRDDRELELPLELAEVMADDPDLSQAWEKLTPGRKKSYILHVNSAKKPETRLNRAVKSRKKILAGKGHLER